MSFTWQQCLALAISNFSRGLPEEALEDIDRMQSVIAGVDVQEKMHAIASAAHVLKENGRVTDAIAYYEQLIELAIVNDPEDIRTARDLSLVATLYHQIGAFEQEGQALERASPIYANVTALQQERLEPQELESFKDRLESNRALLASRRKLRFSLETRKEILRRVTEILRNSFSRIVTSPESLLVEMHNGLVPFSGPPTVDQLTKTLRSYLLDQRRSWMELLGITGPGAEGWRQRQFVTRTFFPDSINGCACLADGTLVAFSDQGATWTAQAGKEPYELALSAAPRKGRYSFRSLGRSLALIDDGGALRFLSEREGVLTELEVEYPGALLLTSANDRYFAFFEDGIVARFDESGRRDGMVAQVCKSPAHVGQMLVLDSGQEVLLVQALAESGTVLSRLWKVHFNPPGVDPSIDIPIQVRGIAKSDRVDGLLVGSLDGLREWKIGEPFPEHGLGGTADQIIRASDGLYSAMSWDGVRVIQFEQSLEAKVPLPGGVELANQLLFDETRNPPLLHVVIGDSVETWEMDKLLWRPSDARLEGWVEKGIFTENGAELVAISPVGVRYLWKVESGILAEFEKFDSKVRMISWAPNGSLGAICEQDAIEIFDKNQIEVARIADDQPQNVTWCEDGHRIAWAGRFGLSLRWAERTNSGFKRKTIQEKEGTHSLSPSLSPDGRTLAIIRSRFRLPSVPEAGVTGRVSWPRTFSHSVNREVYAEPVVLVDLEAGNVVREIPSIDCWWRSVWWLSNRHLFAGDDNGRAAIIDCETARIVACGWTDEPATGGRLIGNRLRLCDSGFSAAVGPVVYDFQVFREGEPLQWD